MSFSKAWCDTGLFLLLESIHYSLYPIPYTSMFYFFHGSDSEKARERARGVLSAMKKKRPNAEYFRITPEVWNSATFEEFVSGQGLFEQKCIVFADGLLENTEAKEWILSHLGEIGPSENAFVFLERKIDAVSVKRFEKHAQEMKLFEEPKPKVPFGKEFSVFGLADALGNRDKKRLWILLSEALMRGEAPEAINGMLFWQVKSMLVAADAPTASAAGLSPFVFTKSKRYAKLYTFDELRGISRTLLSMYHDAHRGLRDFPSALERFALSL